MAEAERAETALPMLGMAAAAGEEAAPKSLEAGALSPPAAAAERAGEGSWVRPQRVVAIWAKPA